MKNVDRRAVLGLLGAGTLSACADPMTIGETKRKPKGGIGGTGIVGTLTEFGSLLINGLRIETPADLAVTDAFGGVAASTLALGQSLTVEASGAPDGLQAQRVHIAHPVIGQVEAIGAGGTRMRVAGVQVRVAPGVTLNARPGDRVAISGLWDGKEIVASRIDPVGPGPDVLAGALRQWLVERAPTLGGVSIDFQGVEVPEIGSYVTLIGQASGAGFLVERVTPGRFTGAAGPLQALSVEGYLTPLGRAPYYEIAGLGHSFDPDARLGAFRTGRTLFDGAYIGTFQVQTGVPVPEDQAARVALMQALRAGQGTRIPAR